MKQSYDFGNLNKEQSRGVNNENEKISQDSMSFNKTKIRDFVSDLTLSQDNAI